MTFPRCRVIIGLHPPVTSLWEPGGVVARSNALVSAQFLHHDMTEDGVCVL